MHGQSALEFITSYSFVFLIIAIAIALLFLFVSIPRTVLPGSCNFYSGFTCIDSFLYQRQAGGTSLVIVAAEQQPGVVNYTSFNAVLNDQKSTGGYCLPKTVVQGQYIYCVANFTFTSIPSVTYTGTASINAAYCAQNPENVSLITCLPSALSNAIFTGNVRDQPTVASETVNTLINGSQHTLFYVPITITNNQPIATPAPFQQMLTVDSQAYGNYITPSWNNVEFTTLPGGRGRALASWIEANASNTATQTSVWVNLPYGIPANSNATIYMDFMKTAVLSASGPTGEMPLISAQYGQYDNGRTVFNLYDNFAGSTLNATMWNSIVPTGGTLTVANSLTLTSSTQSNTPVVLSRGKYTPYIIEANMTEPGAHSNVYDGEEFGWASSAYNSSLSCYFGNAYSIEWVPVSATYYLEKAVNSVCIGSIASASNDVAIGVFGLDWPSTGTENFYVNYQNILGASSSAVKRSPSQAWIAAAQGGPGGGDVTIQWIRVRASPPNGAMPVAAYTGVQRFT